MDEKDKGTSGEFIEDVGVKQLDGAQETHGQHVEGNIKLLDAEGQIRLVPTPRYVAAQHRRI